MPLFLEQLLLRHCLVLLVIVPFFVTWKQLILTNYRAADPQKSRANGGIIFGLKTNPLFVQLVVRASEQC